jgi:phospholipase/carboxylesterase
MASLFHLVREPREKLDRNPLLLLLHGYGSNEEDLFAFADQLPGRYYVVSARAPYDLPPYGHAWYAIDFMADETKFSDLPQARASRDRIAAFIDELHDAYPIDPADVTLIGFSQGSILSYAIAFSYPEKIRRVAAMSGYLNADIIREGSVGKDFSGLRFFVSHGTADQVVPVQWERDKSIPFLESHGVDFMYKEYPIGHGVSPQNFYDLMAWLDATSLPGK